jgi:hypothetical protein
MHNLFLRMKRDYQKKKDKWHYTFESYVQNCIHKVMWSMWKLTSRCMLSNCSEIYKNGTAWKCNVMTNVQNYNSFLCKSFFHCLPFISFLTHQCGVPCTLHVILRHPLMWSDMHCMQKINSCFVLPSHKYALNYINSTSIP